MAMLEQEQLEDVKVEPRRFTSREEILASLKKARDLTGADMSGLDLRGIKLMGLEMSEADLHESDLTGATLAGVDMVGVDLTNARMKGVRIARGRHEVGLAAGGESA